MTAKQIAYDQEARERIRAGVEQARPRRQGHARPRAAAT